MNAKRIKKPLWRRKRLLSASYALGWYTYDYMGHVVAYHGGRVAGFSSLIAFSPRYQVGIIILANSNTPLPGVLMAKFFDLLFALKPVNWSKILLATRNRR